MLSLKNGVRGWSDDVVSLVGDSQQLALVGVEGHEPLTFPFLKVGEVLMKGFSVFI